MFCARGPSTGDVTVDVAPGPPCKDRTSVRASGRAPELGRGHPTGDGRSSSILGLVGGLSGKLV